MREPIFRQKLTKALFLELEEGLYLASNTYLSRGIPSFAEVIAPPEKREAQWQRIRAASVNGRSCNVFASECSSLRMQRIVFVEATVHLRVVALDAYPLEA